MEKVRIGIIGFGRMGITHYSIINTHPAVEMTAIADTSSMMLGLIKKYLPNTKMFEDYKDLLNSGLVDAVIVCTPSVMHYDVCKMAAEKGISVFCEKPFTTSPVLAKELADIFEQKGLVNQVGYVYRFDVVFNKVKEMLGQQLIGKVCHSVMKVYDRRCGIGHVNLQGVAWSWCHALVVIVVHTVSDVACVEKGDVLEHDKLTGKCPSNLTDFIKSIFPFHIINCTICTTFYMVVLIVIIGVLKNAIRSGYHDDK